MTQQEKHTPGPWKQGSEDDTNEYYYSINHEYGPIPICRINAQDSGHQANARLIAAAPELLKLADEMLEIIEYNRHKLNVSEFEAEIKEVIAKAT